MKPLNPHALGLAGVVMNGTFILHGLSDGFGKFTAEDWVGKHTAVSDEDFAKNPLRNRLAVLFSRTAHIAYHLGQGALVKD